MMTYTHGKETEMFANLASALVRAQGIAQAVAKSSTNAFARYKYASAEAMIAEGRGALNEAGLAFITVRWEVLPPAVMPAEGLPQPASSRVKVYYLLMHTSGESMSLESETSVIAEKGRPQDKAEATALTYNLGYFIRGLLLLPREDEDTAVDRRDDRGGPSDHQRRPEPPKPSADRPAPKPDAPTGFDTLISTEDFIAAVHRASSIAELQAISLRVFKVSLTPAGIAEVRAAWTARKAAIAPQNASAT